MINGIRTLYPCGFNKKFSSKFHVDSQVWQETPEEGWRAHWPKQCQYNKEDEDNSLNTLNDKNLVWNFQNWFHEVYLHIYIYIYIYIYIMQTLIETISFMFSQSPDNNINLIASLRANGCCLIVSISTFIAYLVIRILHWIFFFVASVWANGAYLVIAYFIPK